MSHEHKDRPSGARAMSSGWARFSRRFPSASAGSNTNAKDKKKEDKDAPELTGLEKLLRDTGRDGAPIQQDGNDKFFGLENFGNTCYANSILQSLYFSEPFREEVINYPSRAPLQSVLTGPDGQPRFNIRLSSQANANTIPLNKQKNPASPATAVVRSPAVPAKPEDKFSSDFKKKQALLKGPILRMDYDNSNNYGMTESLFTTMKDIFEGVIANQTRMGVVSPTKLVETLKQTNETFRSAMHQDAHEFLNLLLNEVIDTVEADVKTRGAAPKALEHSNGSPVSPRGSVASVATAKAVPNGRWVHDLFQGTLTSETRCLSCETTSQRDEPFIDLSVDIEQHSSVTACLGKFSEEEMLCERNKFHCDNCGGLQEAEKRMKIKRLPRILALHLKRFKYTEDFSRLQKLFHRVVYPFYLRLFNTTDDAEEPDKLYELYAIVVHIGAGPYQGHYVAVVKTKDSGWLLFDDELVEPVEKEFVQNFFGDRPGQACAYLLFYQETTIEAVRREQARGTNVVIPRPISVGTNLTSHGLGVDTKGLGTNGLANVPVLETPVDENTELFGRTGIAMPQSPERTPVIGSLPTVRSIDAHNEALQHVSTAPGRSELPPNGESHAPASHGPNGSGLFSRMRRGSKSGKKPNSGFWGSLDLTKEGKGKDKEKDLSKRKSKDMVRDMETAVPSTPGTAGLMASGDTGPSEPAAPPDTDAAAAAVVAAPGLADKEEEPEAPAATPKKNKFGSLLRRRATELRKSTSRGNILGSRKEEKVET